MSDSSYSHPQPEETSREDRSFAPVETARSWLMLSGRTQIDLTAQVRATAADVVVVDLEDHVPESEKPAARERMRAWLDGEGEAWVRIDARSTDFWAPAVAALKDAPGLQGIILAKTESAAQAHDTVEAFPNVPVVALIESGLGLQQVDVIARSGVARLGFGTGDFRRDTRLASPSALAYPRTRIAIASAATGLPGPIDGGTSGTDPASIRLQAGVAIEFGFTGKFALKEEQIAPLHESFGAR